MANTEPLSPVGVGTVETEADFGSSPEDQVAYWLAQDKVAEKLERKWIRSSKKIVKRYRDDRSQLPLSTEHRYNVLWSNVQTLRPAIYNRTPKPDVERRFHDQDDIGRTAAMILERAISNSLDRCSFDLQMNAAVEDWLLPGRGVMRVMYVPHYGDELPDETAENTEKWGASAVVANDGDEDKTEPPLDNSAPDSDMAQAGDMPPPMPQDPNAPKLREVVGEESVLKYVFWEDYREGPARQWSEVPWIRYRAFMKREELIDRFGSTGKKVNLDTSISYQQTATAKSSDDKGDALPDVLKQAEIWEIWDRAKQRVIWIAPGSADLGFLDEVDDPLQLPGFFPSPDPLLATTTTDTRIPVPDYHEYQDQAIELDVLTARIDRLLRALKVSGVYAGSEKQALQQLIDAGTENKLIPVEDWTAFTDKGGLSGLIQWVPIQQIAETVIQLYAARDRTKQALWEISGMADVMRGVSDPSETATAQSIKAQFGTLRLSDRQRQVSRFARDNIRLVAYVIAGQFSNKTISEMTGFPQLQPVPPAPPGPQFIIDQQSGQTVPSPAMQQYQAQVQPIIAQNQKATQQFEAACQLLKTQIKDGFRIDIEADSTIAPDEQAEKQATVEFMQAFIPLMQQMVPIATGNPSLAALAKELTLFVARRFRAARPLEETIETAFDKLASMPPPAPPDQGQQKGDGGAGAIAGANAKIQVAQIQANTQQTIAAQRAAADHEKNVTDAAYKMTQLDLQQSAQQSRADYEQSRVEAEQARTASGLT